VPFADEETWKRTEEYFVQDQLPFNQAAIAQALFPEAGVNSPNSSNKRRLGQFSALPIGSRVVVNPWTNRVEMLKSQPIPQTSARMAPFEAAPFYPHLRRLDASEKPQNGTPH
jgi:hypothetical protein